MMLKHEVWASVLSAMSWVYIGIVTALCAVNSDAIVFC